MPNRGREKEGCAQQEQGGRGVRCLTGAERQRDEMPDRSGQGGRGVRCLTRAGRKRDDVPDRSREEEG